MLCIYKAIHIFMVLTGEIILMCKFCYTETRTGKFCKMSTPRKKYKIASKALKTDP